MKIGIIGSGTVARTLGGAWAKQHEVLIGARNLESVTNWQQSTGLDIQLGSLQEAAAFDEVVLVAINPWTEIESVVKPLAQELQNKVIVDVSNNITFAHTPPKLAFTEASMGERIQAWLPESKIVKTLNHIPALMMVNPTESGILPAIGWVSGNDNDAKQQVMSLLTDIGWPEITDLGDIRQSRLQESIGLTFSIIVMGITGKKD